MAIFFQDNLGKPFPERETIWILLKQDMMEWQWLQLDYVQIICTLLQWCQHLTTQVVSSKKEGCKKDNDVAFLYIKLFTPKGLYPIFLMPNHLLSLRNPCVIMFAIHSPSNYRMTLKLGVVSLKVIESATIRYLLGMVSYSIFYSNYGHILHCFWTISQNHLIFSSPLYFAPQLGVKLSELSNNPRWRKTGMMGLSGGKRISTKRLAILIQRPVMWFTTGGLNIPQQEGIYKAMVLIADYHSVPPANSVGVVTTKMLQLKL